jgi:LmbE family N-acetylglucosaminyl deacetylase
VQDLQFRLITAGLKFQRFAEENMNSLRLLAILAHPDDESLGIGSTLAKYAAENVEIHLICATKGERGWTGDEQDYPGPNALGKIREEELLNAARVLGIKQVSFLGYLDGDLDQADAREATGQIASSIQKIKPQVVITFGPDGAYGHPDHIAISQFATAACLLAADPGHGDAYKVSKLYYFANNKKLVEDYSKIFGNIQMKVDESIRSFVHWEDWIFTTKIDGSPHWRKALEAVNCHTSQVAIYGNLNALAEETSLALWGVRTYYRVFSLVNSGRQQETDLFEGIT